MHLPGYTQLSLVYSVHQSLNVTKCNDKSWDYTVQPVGGASTAGRAVGLTTHAVYKPLLTAATAIAANGMATRMVQQGVPRPPPRCVFMGHGVAWYHSA